jgi:hypothetical protein
MLAAVVLFVFCPVWSGIQTSARGDSPNEYQIKAAFLLNFVKFIEWPADTYPAPQSPFAICVLGEDPFGAVLDNALDGKSVGSHPISLRRMKEISWSRRCQVVFVSSSENRNYPAIVESVRGARVLLVGETEGFAMAGGTIEFKLEENHVRFVINPDAAQRSGLMLSSKLLMLARIVHDGPVAGKT